MAGLQGKWHLKRTPSPPSSRETARSFSRRSVADLSRFGTGWSSRREHLGLATLSAGDQPTSRLQRPGHWNRWPNAIVRQILTS